MRLTKEESLILSLALDEYKYVVANSFGDTNELSKRAMVKLNDLQFRLEDFSNDERLNREKTIRYSQDRIRKYLFGAFNKWDIDRKKRAYNLKTLPNT